MIYITLLCFQPNFSLFEAAVVAECDSLMEALETRKQQLLSSIAEERDVKTRRLREQVAHCSGKLQRATGLLQFSIELLKEADASAFLQVRKSFYKCRMWTGIFHYDHMIYI